MKVIRITMSNGKYDVPLEFVAKHRAEIYAKKDADDGEGTYEENLKNEIAFVMSDDYEGIDWLSNNMDWADVKDIAKKVEEQPEADLNDEFCNAEKEIMDHGDDENE